jgi:Spy/CpxP family protein refolding chaperone
MRTKGKLTAVAAGLLLLAGSAMAQPYGMGPGMMGGYGGYGGPGGPGGPGGYGGYGGYAMGPGMMWGYGSPGGYGMGPGMMWGYGGPGGYAMGPGMMWGYGGGPGGYGRGPGWGYQGDPYAGLDLTPDQRQKIDAIQDETSRSVWQLMQKMHDLGYQMYGPPGQGPADEQTARKAYQAMADTQKEIFDQQLQARKRIDAVLSKEQRERLRQAWGGGR